MCASIRGVYVTSDITAYRGGTTALEHPSVLRWCRILNHNCNDVSACCSRTCHTRIRRLLMPRLYLLKSDYDKHHQAKYYRIDLNVG